MYVCMYARLLEWIIFTHSGMSHSQQEVRKGRTKQRIKRC